MAKKEIIYQGLIDLPVIIDDASIDSPDYFRITKLPSEFNAGINVFEFKGNVQYFSEGTQIYIEVLDSNGDPVYYETNINYESDQQSAIVSVYVDTDTAPGSGFITICSTAYKSASGHPLDQSKLNVRWTSKIFIDPSKRNSAEIIFANLPEVTVFGTTGSYTNLGYPGGSKFVTSSIYELSYILRNNTPLLITSSNSTVGFDSTATAATISITYDNLSNLSPGTFGTVNTSSVYISSISAISGSGIAFLSNPIQFPVNNSNSIYQIANATVVTASITYQQSASLASSTTENSHNLVLAYFDGLQPQIGTVSKIRSYYRSAGVGEYIFSNETDITGQSAEFGFTANTISASFAIATVHRNDRLDFKFEFVNPYGAISKQVVESLNNLFLGGNTYIGGKDNLLTGSLYVAGATGTGVEITGEGRSAMIRSLGYSGFYNATHGNGSGFVMYSGSIQPILGSAESYSGVGLELVANSSSYFKYATSGSGLLDIRTSNFYLGDSSSYIQSVGGAMSINSPYFKLSTLGIVSASAIYVSKLVNSTEQKMIDTQNGILDATNLGRTVFSTMNEYTTSSICTNASSTTGFVTASEFIFHGLPNETKYTIAYQARTKVDTLTAGNAITYVRFVLSYAKSGSINYDSPWTQQGFVVSTSSTGSIGTYDLCFSEDYVESTRQIIIPETSTANGNLLKGTILYKSAVTAGETAAMTSSIKNITVTAGRALVSAWHGGFPLNPVS